MATFSYRAREIIEVREARPEHGQNSPVGKKLQQAKGDSGMMGYLDALVNRYYSALWAAQSLLST